MHRKYDSSESRATKLKKPPQVAGAANVRCHRRSTRLLKYVSILSLGGTRELVPSAIRYPRQQRYWQLSNASSGALCLQSRAALWDRLFYSSRCRPELSYSSSSGPGACDDSEAHNGLPDRLAPIFGGGRPDYRCRF